MESSERLHNLHLHRNHEKEQELEPSYGVLFPFRTQPLLKQFFADDEGNVRFDLFFKCLDLSAGSVPFR